MAVERAIYPPTKTHKVCTICKKEKPLEDFQWRSTFNCYSSQYKRCVHWAVVVKRWNLTVTQREIVAFVEQNYDGTCMLCREPLPENKIHLDHDHATGKPRGLLHATCNALLGMAGDNVVKLRQAISYLEKA
jgi:hypothetical protein